MNISVIIPAFNEKKHIVDTIEALRGLNIFKEIIVVDDGSGDNTYELAKAAGAIAVKTTSNLGKGGALEYGLSRAEGDIIVFLDADIGEGASEVGKLLPPIINGDADMTVAVFPPPKKKGGFGFVKTLARCGVLLATGKRIDWTLSGQRAFRREVLDGISLARGYGIEIALTVDVLRKGCRVQEVAVAMGHEETGRDIAGFVHRGKQFVNILMALIKIMLR